MHATNGAACTRLAWGIGARLIYLVGVGEEGAAEAHAARDAEGRVQHAQRRPHHQQLPHLPTRAKRVVKRRGGTVTKRQGGSRGEAERIKIGGLGRVVSHTFMRFPQVDREPMHKPTDKIFHSAHWEN